MLVRQLNNEKDEYEINREVGAHKWTPLYRAGKKKIFDLKKIKENLLVINDCNKEIIELLLNNGANPECEDKSTGTNALQMAVIRGNLLTTQLLVTHGANTRTLSKVFEIFNKIFN